MRVLFWGTPEFATPALRALTGEGFDVAAVVTQPDKPLGRSRSTVHPSPVKQVAIEEGIDVIQPDRPRDEEFISAIRYIAPDISVVVAYGHILPKVVIDLPRLGTLNIHASLLPRLRGAAPIHAAIRDGLEETGVSIMRMVPQLDAGPVIHTLRTPIADDETTAELSLRLSEMGALALVEALAMIELGQAPEVAQDDALATYAPKIDRTSGRIDWNADARDISRLIRAFDPRPGAFAIHRGHELKLFGARASAELDGRNTTPPGSVVRIDADGMIVACGHDSIRVTIIQPTGNRRLTPEGWAHGRGIAVGERLS